MLVRMGMLRVIVVLVVMMHVAFLAMLVVVAAIVRMLMRVPLLHMRRPAVDVEFHAFDVLPLRAVVVHVEVAEVQLAQLPFERAGFHSEVEECADHHVATDAGDAVEVEGFHGKLRDECGKLRGCRRWQLPLLP